ncbi:hypothetical protein [Streptomyces sp. NBC_00893]|uniref:hypothetical protein n=1 Tax=Streptomyces sp. NBC_00893 TaxID=2975862 RepID=UPI00224FA15E|nr:hypothetical protein [Streptomyces sp. NBC_00893]MCX4848622.1 hypothetical protein [Streptomyces sp. NBC_00893]
MDDVLLVGDVVRFPAVGPALDQFRVDISDPADLVYGQEPPDRARGVGPFVAPALERLAARVNGGAELGCGLVPFGVRHG